MPDRVRIAPSTATRAAVVPGGDAAGGQSRVAFAAIEPGDRAAVDQIR